MVEGTNPHEPVIKALLEAKKQLEECRPNDRSPQDRAYAVTKTEVEKAIAYFLYYVNMGMAE